MCVVYIYIYRKYMYWQENIELCPPFTFFVVLLVMNDKVDMELTRNVYYTFTWNLSYTTKSEINPWIHNWIHNFVLSVPELLSS